MRFNARKRQDKQSLNYRIVKNLACNGVGIYRNERRPFGWFSETLVLVGSRKIFAELAGSGKAFEENISQKELYEKALEMERKSRDLYLAKHEEVTDDHQREIFKKMALEEEKHFKLIDQLLEFIKEPETFLENAEFFKQDDYWMLVTGGGE